MEAARKILDRISTEACAELALELGKIYSPWGQEGDAAEHTFQWLTRHGIEAEKIGMFADRPNILGRLRGSGSGPSLIFNAHLDHAHSRDAKWLLRNPDDPALTSAWRQGSRLYGQAW